MLCVLKFFAVCLCLHESLARPKGVDHNVEKRWAYIENGDPQMRTIHTDCKKIVREYSDGDMPFYEYTAKMKKCVNRQERTTIPSFPSYDGEYFTPSFGVPKTEKRFETPRYYNQMQPSNGQYGNYGYNYNNQNQNYYGSVDQRENIASPQAPQYGVPQTQPQAQAFPATNYNYNQYYQQNQPGQLTARSDIPSYQLQEPNEQQSTMYSSDIVKKDEIPKPHEQ